MSFRGFLADPPLRVVGLLTLVASAVLVAVVVSGIFRVPFRDATREVHVEFDRAPQLRTGDQVRIDGNIDGRVAKLETRADGTGVLATLDVEEKAGPIYADARAQLRVKTLLAGAFYVDIDRGTRAAGELGDRRIPAERTALQVEIEDLTDVFRGPALRGLTTMPPELAEGFEDARAPARALGALADVAPDTEVALRALRGTVPGRDLPGLVRHTARTVRALDAPRDELRTLVSGAAATLDVTDRRSQELRTILDEGPATARQVRTTLARLDRTLGVADDLVGRLEAPVADVAPTLRRLRPTLVSASRLLDRATPLVRALRPAASSLAGAARAGAPVVEALKPSLARLDGDILPALAEKDPVTTKSTSVMIGGFAAGFGGSASQVDGNGHFIRFPASVGSSSVHLPCQSNVIEPDAGKLLACQTLQSALQSYLGYIPGATTPARRVGR
jgi:virulence factor Mce-like protein